MTETKTPNIAELRKVVEAVRATRPEHFEMAVWKCGTCACAVGSYVAAHPDCGLSMVSWYTPQDVWMVQDSNGNQAFDAVAEHFGISKGKAEFLFDPGSYVEDDDEDYGDAKGADIRDEVISRIEDFIAAHADPDADDRHL